MHDGPQRPTAEGISRRLNLRYAVESVRRLRPSDRTPTPRGTSVAGAAPAAVIYRRPVIEQADIIRAMFVIGDEFSAQAKRANHERHDRRLALSARVDITPPRWATGVQRSSASLRA